MRLLLLGSPTLQTDDGQVIEFDTRKAVALLAYLALHDHSFQRDTLATLFWPELDQSRARAALRRTLVPLTHALGENALLPTRDTLALNPAYSLWVDSRAFEAATNGPAETENLQTAAGLYKGDFMAGFTLRDAPEFDDWQFFEADRLRRLYATTLERLIPHLTAQGELAPAIEHARAWLALDPLHEPAHRTLMRLYAQADQRAAALRQYRECVRILDEELGVPPLEETVKLYQDILENRTEVLDSGYWIATPSSPTVIAQPPSPSWGQATNSISQSPISPPQYPISNIQYPLTGRITELTTLLTTYHRPSPDGYFFAIHGEAGVGKTRLAEEFIQAVQRQGALIFSARCYPGQGDLAYNAFVEALRPALSRPDVPGRIQAMLPVWIEESARLLPELANPRGALPPAQTGLGLQARLFEGIRQLILGLSTSSVPGVLFLDDLQWADSASLDLLTYLVRRLQDFPVFILGVWRSEGEDVSVNALLNESVRAGNGQGISLARLTRAEVDELARSAGDFPPALEEKLYEETEGLPFFVVEYLTAAHQGETWPTGGGPSQVGATPRGIQDLQRARLAGLDEASHQLITTAAVLGRSFDFDTLRETSGRSEDETINSLEKLVTRRLLVEKSSENIPIYDFTHEKLRQVVYEDASLTRRRLLHRRVAQYLVSQPRTSPAVIAHHLRQAGQEAEAAEYAFRAGDHARKVYANTEALTHYQTALALGYPAATVHEAIGDLQTLRGDYRAAITSYDSAAALTALTGLPQLELKLGNLHHRRGDYDLAVSFFQAGLELIGDENPLFRAQLTADYSRTAAQKGETALARELAHQTLTLSDTVSDASPAQEEVQADTVQGIRGQAHNLLGMLARRDGNFETATHHLQQALTIAEASGNLPSQAAALNNLALVHEGVGAYDRAIEFAQTALDLCARMGDRHREAALRNRLADLFHASGQTASAMYHLKKAVEIFAEIGVEVGELEPEIWKLTEW